jgi:Holliday junction resolvasome RuvABC endonuclease subunit
VSADAQVIGLDLSLAHTGIAHADGHVEVFEPKADKHANAGMDRMMEIRHQIRMVTVSAIHLELVVMEGLAFDAHDTNRMQAQLAGIIRSSLYEHSVPYLMCPPGTLKKYATGNGAANKVEVILAAGKRLGYEGHNDNEADALWLRAIGCELLGVPVCDMPQSQQAALNALRRQRPILAV